MAGEIALASEQQRLSDLRQLGILDTASENTIDALTQLAANTMSVPVASVTLVDRARIWLKSKVGTDLQEVPREDAFCHYTIASRDVFVILDAATDPRFAKSVVVADHGVRFYAGAPIVLASGAAVGAICVLDTLPHASLPMEHRALLTGLASAVAHLLDLRRELQARKIAERDLAEHARMLELAEDVAGVGHWRHDIRSGSIYLSPAVYKIYGLDPAAGRPTLAQLRAMYEAEDKSRVEACVAEAERSGSGFSIEMKLTRANDGSARTVRADGRVERDDSGAPAVLIGVMRDVTEEKKSLEVQSLLRHEAERRAHRMRQLAETDALTGLPNRRAFFDLAEQALATADEVTLVVIDLDYFKAINDGYGHHMGDKVLERFGSCCASLTADNRFFGRIGGEEFALLIAGRSRARASHIIAELREAVSSEPIATASGGLISITFSAGLAVALPHDDWRTLFSRADQALYRAKRDGRDRLAVAA